MPTPVFGPAFIGPLTWDDSGWRCCRTCDAEWRGETPCFVEPSHAGASGRLRSWCGHGLRCVPGPDGTVCQQCDQHGPSDFTPEFLDAFALAADWALRAAGI